MFTRAVARNWNLTELQYSNMLKKKIAVILGSCVWDLLANQSSSTESPTYSFEKNEHLNAIKTLIKTVQRNYPEFVFIGRVAHHCIIKL